MTKAEYLRSIGYECESWYDEEIHGILYKMYEASDGSEDMTMYINLDQNIYFIEMTTVGNIKNQRQIDDLQIAFNNVKRDFEEMQKYED